MSKLSDCAKVYIIEGYTIRLQTMIELARQYGVTRNAVYKVLKCAGVDTSKVGAANIKVSCTSCGKEIIVKRCMFRTRKHVFCDHVCYYAFLKHGNGNPLIMNRQCSRIARTIVSKYFTLPLGSIVHHEDRNDFNNNPDNLIVFANQGDHVRHHRGFIVPILWKYKQ
jgi:hypothetical protein